MGNNLVNYKSARNILIPMLIIMLQLSVFIPAQGEKDMRADNLRDPDHFHVSLGIPPTREAWVEKQSILRERLLLFAGLWPEPEKNDLNPVIFDEKRGNGFLVSKVFFESLPGFYVTGNLYRPEAGKGPFPAILTPHGHTTYGRLNNDTNISIPGRCIDFARQGYVVLSIDMIGYNDSLQLPHDGLKQLSQLRGNQPVAYEHRLFRAEFDFPQARLYGLTLGGLQLWNGIRSIDFLASLNYVNPNRIGVTGCSGGATQTTWFMIADDRVQAAAPVNIIGTNKHPGCLCENIPGLWIEMSMPELAAAFAPKPLLLVSATEDPWTNQTPAREFPLIRSFYQLFQAENSIANFHTNAGHNFNPQSRKAVYEWMNQHLNPNQKVIDPVPDFATETTELGDLRVFPDHLLPEKAKSGRQIIADWIESARASVEREFPFSSEEYPEWKQLFREKLRMLLAVEVPSPGQLNYRVITEESREDLTYRKELIGRSNKGDWIELESVSKNSDPRGAVLLVFPEGFGPFLDPENRILRPWAGDMINRGMQVYRVRGYASGHQQIPAREYDRWLRSSSYNRSNELNGIQDIVTAICSIRDANPDQPLLIAGLGKTGLYTLFAAAIQGSASRVIVDFNSKDPGYDGDLLDLLPVTSIRKIGDVRTAILLLAEKRLTIFNAATTFNRSWIDERMERLNLNENWDFQPDESSVSFVSLE